jgi:hypothetical protein
MAQNGAPLGTELADPPEPVPDPEPEPEQNLSSTNVDAGSPPKSWFDQKHEVCAGRQARETMQSIRESVHGQRYARETHPTKSLIANS